VVSGGVSFSGVTDKASSFVSGTLIPGTGSLLKTLWISGKLNKMLKRVEVLKKQVQAETNYKDNSIHGWLPLFMMGWSVVFLFECHGILRLNVRNV